MRYLLGSLFLLMTATTAAGLEFQGEWRVDVDATLAQIEAGPMPDGQMARELPTLLEQMRPIAYRFEGKNFITSLGEQSESVRWHMLEEDSPSFHVMTELRGERTELRIEMLSLNHMRLASQRDDELRYLIWRRVGAEDTTIDGLAMH
jgi:hypothetical protein